MTIRPILLSLLCAAGLAFGQATNYRIVQYDTNTLQLNYPGITNWAASAGSVPRLYVVTGDSLTNTLVHNLSGYVPSVVAVSNAKPEDYSATILSYGSTSVTWLAYNASGPVSNYPVGLLLEPSPLVTYSNVTAAGPDTNGWIDPYAANLIARWDFEGNAEDSTANGQDLTVVGATNTIVGTNERGRVEMAYYFDGTDDSLRREIAGADVLLASNDTVSISLWVNRISVAAAAHVFDFQGTNGTANGIIFNVYNVNTNAYLQAKVSNAIKQNFEVGDVNSVPTNEWTHMAYQISAASGTYAFVDGSLVASNVGAEGKATWAMMTTGNVGVAMAYVLGCTWANSSDYRGHIDNVKLYSNAVPFSHFAALFTNTCPTNCLEAR